jgi:hypothetical protein
MKIFLGNQFNGKYKMLYDFNQNRRERDRPFPWKPAVLKKIKRALSRSVRPFVLPFGPFVPLSSLAQFVVM